MKISLLMPTKNRREFLPRAIASVLAQDYQDWELLIGACSATMTNSPQTLCLP